MARLTLTFGRNDARVYAMYTRIKLFLIIYTFYMIYPAHPEFSPKQLGMHKFKKTKDYFYPFGNHWERQKSSFTLTLSLSHTHSHSHSHSLSLTHTHTHTHTLTHTHTKQEEKPTKKESKCMNGRFRARVRSLKYHKT